MNELTIKNGKELNVEQIALVKRTLVPTGVKDDEFAMFVYLANKYDLDPFLKEIIFIKRRVWNNYKREYDEVPSIMTTRDGFLSIAHKTGVFGGMETQTTYNQSTVEGAICKVWNKSFPDHPVVVEVKFKEYCALNKEGKPQALWASKPETMIKKVAESQALRKAFNIKGIYSEEELEKEIKENIKTELEYGSETLKLSEKLNDTAAYDKFREETMASIMDSINLTTTDKELWSVKKQFEKEIGLLNDQDRAYVEERFESHLNYVITGNKAEGVKEAEITPETASNSEIQGTKPPDKTENELLAEKEAWGQDFLKKAIAELKLCSTKAQLAVFKNKHTQDRLKLLADARDYFDQILKDAFSKAK